MFRQKCWYSQKFYETTFQNVNNSDLKSESSINCTEFVTSENNYDNDNIVYDIQEINNENRNEELYEDIKTDIFDVVTEPEIILPTTTTKKRKRRQATSPKAPKPRVIKKKLDKNVSEKKESENDSKSNDEIKVISKKKMCEVCGKTLANLNSLKNHLQLAHTDYRPFVCTFCDFRTARKYDLDVCKL